LGSAVYDIIGLTRTKNYGTHDFFLNKFLFEFPKFSGDQWNGFSSYVALNWFPTYRKWRSKILANLKLRKMG